MKTRSGFVSNSSSSSFLLALDHKPKDGNDMYNMMFGNTPVFTKYYDTSLEYDSQKDNYLETPDKHALFTSLEISEFLFKVLSKAKYRNISAKEVLKHRIFDYGYTSSDYPEYYEFCEKYGIMKIKRFYNWIIARNPSIKNNRRIDYNLNDSLYKYYEKLKNKFTKQESKKFFKDNSGKYYVIIRLYDDNYGGYGGQIESYMEHTPEMFGDLKYVRCSEH